MGLEKALQRRENVAPHSGIIGHRPAAGGAWTTVQAAIDAFGYTAPNVAADGATDDQPALQAALNAMPSTGGRLWVKPGVYYLASTLTVPANVSIQGAGRGATIFRVPAGASFTVIDIHGVDNVYLADFAIEKTAGADSIGFAIVVRSACDNITIERVLTGGADLPAVGSAGEGFVNGVHVAGQEGSTPGLVTRLTLRDVECNNSPTSWGIHLAHCTSPLLDNCRGKGNALDGLKLHQKTFNVRVIGGEFSDNGWGYTWNPVTYAGDGIDAFSGGDTFVCIGTVCKRNYGNGVTVKTGPLATFPAATWGYIRRTTIRDVDFSDNLFMGLYLTMSTPLDATEPVPNRSTVTGTFDNNGQDGIYITARNVVIGDGASAKGNGRYGITVSSRAFDVTISQAVAVANAIANLEIIGQKVRVFGGTYYGVDPDQATAPADLAAATPVSTYCIQVESTAADVQIHYPEVGYQSDALDIRVRMTSGVCVIHRQGSGSPFSVALQGSYGSTWIRTNTGGFGVDEFIKSSADPSLTTGWAPRNPTLSHNKTVNTSQTAIAHGLPYTPTQYWWRANGDARVWKSAAADSTNVYLTASSTVTVDLFAH